MSVLLYVIGAIAAAIGVAMAGYGIPINEFSFGNTLIGAGTTAIVGGLIVIALGAAVAQLQRIVESLAERAPIGAREPVSTFEPLRPERARIPFPPRPKPDAAMREPLPAVPMAAAPPAAGEEQPAAPVAPALRNPDLPPPVVETVVTGTHEEFALSPGHPAAPEDLAESAPPLGVNGSGAGDHAHEPAFDDFGRPSAASQPEERKSSPGYFDRMWPAEPKPVRHPAVEEPRHESMPESAPAAAVEPGAGAPPVAILKSGVVDGMAYTLYVDGSIEAELPHGTLHFPSINELREHLARTS